MEGPRSDRYFPRVDNEPLDVVDEPAMLNQRRTPILGRQAQVPQSLLDINNNLVHSSCILKVDDSSGASERRGNWASKQVVGGY